MLAAVALARATGAPLLGCLLGLQGSAPPDGSGRTVRLSPTSTGPSGAAELGVLADLSLGSALRAKIGRDHRLATVSLTVDLSEPLPAAADLAMDSSYVAEAGRTVLSTGAVRAGAENIGAGLATFSARERGAGLLPWEPPLTVSPAPLAESDLTADEAAVLATVTSSPLPPVSALLQAALCTLEPGRLRLRATPVLGNRAGAVQGGVLFGLVASAAASYGATDPSVPDMLDAVHIDYVAPALLADELLAEATVLRESPRIRWVRVELHRADTLVAVATVRHRKPAHDELDPCPGSVRPAPVDA